MHCRCDKETSKHSIAGGACRCRQCGKSRTYLANFMLYWYFQSHDQDQQHQSQIQKERQIIEFFVRKKKKRKGKSKKKMSWDGDDYRWANEKEGSHRGVKKRRKEERANFSLTLVAVPSLFLFCFDLDMFVFWGLPGLEIKKRWQRVMQGDDIKYEHFSTCGKLQYHSSIASMY